MSFSFVANWKNVLLPAQERTLLVSCEELAVNLPKGYDLAICPSFLSLDRGRDICRVAHLCAQDLFEDETVCTGTQTARQLSELGVEMVCIGHLERQKRFHEDGALIVQKTQTALLHGLQPIVCLSEENAAPLLEQILQDETVQTSGVPMIFAYEPSVAIGGHALSARELQPIFTQLRTIASTYPTHSRFLYGGGVDIASVSDLLSLAGLDGFLLGRVSHSDASLRSFLEAVITHRSSSASL